MGKEAVAIRLGDTSEGGPSQRSEEDITGVKGGV